MKSVLISIRPEWCELIASGKKTIEVRKTRPTIETPFKCYIYETKAQSNMPTFVDEDGHVLYTGRGQVIGEFVCNMVDIVASIRTPCMDYITVNDKWNTHFSDISCLNADELGKYLGFNKDGYGWHISDLKIYDKPRELSEFAVADKKAIRQCEYREQSYYAFTDTGYIKNGFYCKKKDDWCFGECKRKALTRPPQSYMFVEEV